MSKILKTLMVFALLCSLLMACKKKVIDYSNMAVEAPVRETNANSEYNLNFVNMHNFVIDSLQSEFTPFFYIVEDEFDIDGNNDDKLIEVKCKCLDGCVESDIDLFFTYVLNYISINAAEQDYRFEAPHVDSTGTYIDYGTVFNTYDLKLYCESESGEIIYDEYIKKGETIPIDPRYIKES